MRLLIPVLSLAVATATTLRAQFPFPISPDKPLTGIVDFSDLNATPAGADGFVRRDGEQFVTGAGPVRFWGVNLCFGANFPERADAEKLAAHLSSLAVNCVRIHHHETQYSPSGLYDRDTKNLDPAQVEKLDYLLAQLHSRGIYANLNLHVGRSVARELGLPPLGAGHSATGDKHLLHFYPPVQEAFWQYCRDYLGHTNPHRKLRRADDPGIAMIEILNENRFHLDGAKHLATAPEPYRSEIVKQWNAWLKKKYNSDGILRAAWFDKKNPPGKPIATGDDWHDADRDLPLNKRWRFTVQGGKPAPAITSAKRGTLRVAPKAKAEVTWHYQLSVTDLSIAKGKLYTLQFEARADQPRPLSFNVATLEGGWSSLGLSDTVQLKANWQTFTHRFTATDDSAAGKLAFDLGGAEHAVELRALTLRPGASWKILPDRQSIAKANVAIPDASWSPSARSAFTEFMAYTERNFYLKTRAVLKELGVRVPVTTTQVNYQGAAMAAELADYTDIHSYWHHPLFPGKQWDGNNWTIGHDPLEARPFANKWPRNNPMMRSSWRVHGMPFTYSEWNVGEPSFPSAGAIPVMALLGSLQDWDGIFFFDYASSAGTFGRDKITTYFSLCGQPAKLAVLGPFGALYRSGGLAPLTETHIAAPETHEGSGALAFSKRVGIDPTHEKPADFTAPDEAALLKSHPPLLVTPDGSAKWDARDPNKAIITLNLPTVRAVWGKIGGQTVVLGGWKFEIGDPPSGYGIIIAQSRDGLPLDKSKRILITSVSHAGNRNFPWKDTQRSAGGKNWGDGPAQVWNVPFRLTIPPDQTARTCRVISNTGKPVRPISASPIDLGGASTKSIWFELVRD